MNIDKVFASWIIGLIGGALMIFINPLLISLPILAGYFIAMYFVFESSEEKVKT